MRSTSERRRLLAKVAPVVSVVSRVSVAGAAGLVSLGAVMTFGAACSTYESADIASTPITEDGAATDPEEDGASSDDAGKNSDAAGTETDGDAGFIDGGDAGAEDAGCTVTTSPLMFAKADALLSRSNAASNYGGKSICNMAQGRCILRFDPDTETASALKTGRARAMKLVVRRADKHKDCEGTDCRALRDDGTLYALPLRNDWNESEVAWNFRFFSLSGNGWGAGGAGSPGTDIGAVGGETFVTAGEDIAVLNLDPRGWSDTFVDVSGSVPHISVRLEFLAGGSVMKRFIAVMRETSDGVSPQAPAELKVSYCPSM